MGEIADMMIDGLMCEGCGEFMDDHEEPGYPRRCSACEPLYKAYKEPHSVAHAERNRMVKPNQEWTDEHGHFRVMAVAEKYAMCRRKGAAPFVRSCKEINEKCHIKGSRP